jgi:glycosyltransferase involved in cell wall biosynthesis
VLRVAVDGTPLLGRRTGIGRYTENLLAALASRVDVALSATAFTLRGAGSLTAAVPAGVATRSLPVPARLLRSLWSSVDFPAVRWFAGSADVFHATNFVLPPTGRTGGVVTIHDLAFLTMPDTVDRASLALQELVPRSLSRAAAVCTPSAAVAGQIREAYGPGCPEIIVTPLGVDPEWLAVAAPSSVERERLGLPGEYFLFVGTREPRKDLATLLAAYAEFRLSWPASGGPAPELLLVGPDGWGPGQEPVDGVVIRDYAPTAELRTIVAGAAALVMPSRDEGFGLPALEGLAAGVPVIVSSVPALVEVTGGRAAVFPVGDVEALAAELLAVAADAGINAGEVARSRREYAARWTWATCAEATVSAYRIAAG